MDWEFGVGKCKLCHSEWVNSRVLLYGTGNCIQSPEISHNGKKIFFRMYLLGWPKDSFSFFHKRALVVLRRPSFETILIVTAVIAVCI